MRIVAVALLCAAAVACTALAAPLPAPGAHLITCASARVERDYQEGLRLYHLGNTEAAIRRLQEVVKRDPGCAMGYMVLSRAQERAGQHAEALASLAKAEGLAGEADDREQRFISAWGKMLKAPAAEAERGKALAPVRGELDRALAVYPDDPELWLLRGDAAESPLRATPFYLAALRVQPGHPFGSRWQPKAPPCPELTPAPTQPVAAPKSTPPLFEGLGKLSHPILTKSPEAQAYYEQGLRLFHAYVTPMQVKNSAAQCFQYAASLDPDCAMAYWGLSLIPESPAPMKQLDAANRALELAIKNGSDKERRFATARILQLSGNQKQEEFFDALDGAIAAYPDDVELWIWRGWSYANARAASPGNWPAAIVFQQAAHRIQPEHPAPNHEMVHGYEALQLPALGWPYAEGFRDSAPNLPHANHMQAHLAMRLGRWREAVEGGRTARKRALAGFPELDPSHHIDIMVRALGHEGLFREAEAEPKAYREGLPWARLLQLKAVPEELAAWAERRSERNAPDGYYIGAVLKLDANDLPGAEPLVAKVEEQWKKSSVNPNL
ncbi:MAG TPA: tetratricopeptide repeat protein, partial [Armatimonadota bacterium]|nr:tetratricopeptide repeat protein [Armatimonadota bacterium]